MSCLAHTLLETAVENCPPNAAVPLDRLDLASTTELTQTGLHESHGDSDFDLHLMKPFSLDEICGPIDRHVEKISGQID